MQSMGYIVLALTPIERWSAARSMRTQLTNEPWFIFAAAGVLAILILLLLWIGHLRRSHEQSQTQEQFADIATRRGLSIRERQVLLAVAMRSGLSRSQEIFTTAQAFERGVTRLLAECSRTRTVEENERLNAEIVYLREKLGFPVPWVPGAPVQSRRPSSRDIPEGRHVEATRRIGHKVPGIRARVVRNDDIELVLELDNAVDSRANDLWRIRYSFGMSVWEFDTLAVSCQGTRLVLNHNDQVRFVNRRRFPRVAIQAPALVAVCPFMQRGSAERDPQTGRILEGRPLEEPAFVEAQVVELAGPGLRIRTSVRVPPGERVLVVFRVLDQVGLEQQEHARPPEWRTIMDIGQVKHCQESGDDSSIAVELTGLSNAGLDELVRLTNQAARADRQRPHGEMDALEFGDDFAQPATVTSSFTEGA